MDSAQLFNNHKISIWLASSIFIRTQVVEAPELFDRTSQEAERLAPVFLVKFIFPWTLTTDDIILLVLIWI